MELKHWAEVIDTQVGIGCEDGVGTLCVGGESLSI